MDLDERVAILEVRLQAVEERQHELIALVKQMKADQDKQRGFIGGVVFVVSGLWTVLLIIGPWVAKKLGIG